ncbi:unnamed protein product [Bursaphelenchus xylophilus]|uniref:(pine wood nematode) hypothetical protein n=1 Tax=Bursaphelenchus xylophilus TaxID=6326 RepID=A0A1I7RVU7_BURXY|nr:unnamed protein product [Bursaphelenchus xylophilus]CAG9082200.1 unnamed protein product [Bursaphelenchus xylophilus]
MVLWNNLPLLFPLVLAANDDINSEDFGTIVIVLVVIFVGLILFAGIIGAIFSVVSLVSHRKAQSDHKKWDEHKSKVMKKLTPSDYFVTPNTQTTQKTTPEAKTSGAQVSSGG